jgi:beta-lactamase regulating signal transducer with metallopeptidase domain
MKLLNDWIPENLMYALGWTLVHSVWQLIIIAGLLWIALRIIQTKSPDFKYKLALGGMFLSLIVGVGTFMYEYALFNPASAQNLNAFQVVFLDQTAVSSELSLDDSIQNLVNWIEIQLPLLVNIWFLGALLFMFRLVNSLSELRTMRKSSSEPTDFQLEKMLYRLSGKLGIDKIPALQITQVGQSPITFGFLKPIILIPAGLILHLSSAQLEAIIAHELAHVKRNDYLANLLQSGLEVLFFYHPCYWWMSQTVKELRENAADDLVIQAGVSPKDLAYALAEVLNFAKQNPPELALAAGKYRNPTLQRIKRMLGYPAQNYPQNPIISLPMLLTLLLSAGLMASAQQDAPPPAEKLKPLAAIAPAANPQPIPAVFPFETPVPVADTSDSKKHTYRVVMKGDTIISGVDTIIINGESKYIFKGSPDFNWGEMPVLELAEAPVFPEGFMAPPVFPVDMFPVMAPLMIEPMVAMAPMIPMVFDFDEGAPGTFYFSDTTKMTPEEREKWAKKSEEWAKMAEMKADEWAKKSEEWAKEFEPKMKEFELKMKEWEKSNEPKIKEFEMKIQEWEKAQGPKMKEFEEKMKIWEKEQQPKLEEFQRKMEEWQKENAKKMEEFQRKLEEEFNKKDN